MSDEYRVPKRKVPATVLTLSGETIDAFLFLTDSGETHLPGERPSEFIAATEGFFPAVKQDGGFTVISMRNVCSVAVPSEEEMASGLQTEDLGAELAKSISVQVTMSNGSTVAGTVVFVLPEAQQRLLDFLNLPEPFFTVRDGDLVHLVNKAHVSNVTPVKDD